MKTVDSQERLGQAGQLGQVGPFPNVPANPPAMNATIVSAAPPNEMAMHSSPGEGGLTGLARPPPAAARAKT